MSRSEQSRRRFLQNSLAIAGAGFAIGGTRTTGRVLGANDTIRLAVAGVNGRGMAHIDEFSKTPGVEFVDLVDPDERTYEKALRAAMSNGRAPKTVCDVRHVLDDKNVVAVSIATPNHWHSLMTIWACQAGKDVYVEKPCSHNIHEGQVAVEAARKYNRIVQHGTQGRSDRHWAEAVALIRSGKLGKLNVSRALCYKRRDSIGEKPTTTPRRSWTSTSGSAPRPNRPTTTPRPSAIWPTSRTGSAPRSRSARRPRRSATTRPPTRRSPGWKSI